MASLQGHRAVDRVVSTICRAKYNLSTAFAPAFPKVHICRLAPIEQVERLVFGGHDDSALAVQRNIVILGVDIDDVQILNNLLKRLPQTELKGNSPQAVVVERNLLGKEDHLIDLRLVLAAQFIIEVRRNFFGSRIVKPEMVVEPSRPVDQEIA